MCIAKHRITLYSQLIVGIFLAGIISYSAPTALAKDNQLTIKLGKEISPKTLAAIDLSITPDGKNLPKGSGTPDQGAKVYAAKCASCHGVDAKGGKGLADPLVGGIGSLNTKKPIKTVGSYWPFATTLFDYTRRAMPLDAPRSLSNDEVYAVSAYILYLNNIIKKDDILDEITLPQVKMPNRDGFVSQWPGYKH